MSSYSIAVWAGTGIGGTEKCATLFACAMRRRGHRVFYLGEDGPRARILAENRVTLVNTATTPDALLNFLYAEKIDVLHQHVPGYPAPNPLYDVLKKMGRLRPKFIETNVFGRLEDAQSLELVDYRMFICQTSATQAFRRAGKTISEASLACHTVVNYPVLPPPKTSSDDRYKLRESLGLKEVDLLGVRLGRPGHKWSTWECEAFAKASRKLKNIRLILMEPSESIWRDVEAGCYGPGILLRHATTDFAWLDKLYSSADFSIHASDWGESFGYTIAEAMSAGLPVITMSTPWGDNAQVELIQNKLTGFVCRGPEEMSRRICDLAKDASLRKKLGDNGRLRIELLSDMEREAGCLEAVIEAVVSGRDSSQLKERRIQLMAFSQDFQALQKDYSEPTWCDPISSFRRGLYSLYRQSRAEVRNRKGRV